MITGTRPSTAIDAERTMLSDREMITVVIPVRNEEHFIAACLTSVLQQDERNLQVIVVDGASTDATVRVVRVASSEICSCLVLEPAAVRFAAVARGNSEPATL